MWCWSLTKVSQASGNDGFMFWTAHKWKGTILVSLRLIVISAATFIMAKYCGKRWIGWRLTKKALLEGFCGLLWSFWLTLGMVLLFRASGRWSSAQWKAPTGDELWYALLMMLQVIVFVLIFQYATVQLLLCRLTFTNAAWFISLVCGFTLAASTGGSWRSFVFFTLFNLLGCYMYLATRSLWLPVAFESGWVFFQGICFGLPSACTRLLGGPEKMSVAPPGKVWLFGSQWGIEGG